MTPDEQKETAIRLLIEASSGGSFGIFTQACDKGTYFTAWTDAESYATCGSKLKPAVEPFVRVDVYRDWRCCVVIRGVTERYVLEGNPFIVEKTIRRIQNFHFQHFEENE